MVVVTKSEILFLKNKSNDYITYYLCEYINCINDNRNILYITYNYSKKVLLSKFNSLDKENIIVVDNPATNFDNIEHLIIEKAPRYVFVDYFNLTKTRKYFYVNNMKLKDLKSKVEEYESKYNVVFIIVINDRNGDEEK